MFPYDRDISRLFHILRRAGGALPPPGIRHPALKVSITARGIPSPAELSLTYTSLILIITVAVAACCAAVLFIPLRRAPVRRRLLTYFISMPVFVFLSVFFFSDIGTALAALGVGAAGLSAEFFGYTGITAVCGAGIVYLGFCALLCSHGAMKKKGRTAILVTSLVYFALEYLLWVAALFAGKVERYTLGEVFPAVGKVSFLAPAAESGLFAFSILLLVLYITGYLLSFTAVMKDGETESPAARGGKSRAESGDAAVAKRRAIPTAESAASPAPSRGSSLSPAVRSSATERASPTPDSAAADTNTTRSRPSRCARLSRRPDLKMTASPRTITHNRPNHE